MKLEKVDLIYLFRKKNMANNSTQFISVCKVGLPPPAGSVWHRGHIWPRLNMFPAFSLVAQLAARLWLAGGRLGSICAPDGDNVSRTRSWADTGHAPYSHCSSHWYHATSQHTSSRLVRTSTHTTSAGIIPAKVEQYMIEWPRVLPPSCEDHRDQAAAGSEEWVRSEESVWWHLGPTLQSLSTISTIFPLHLHSDWKGTSIYNLLSIYDIEEVL